ncbi:MAG: exopolysaccharide biosynthesis polyprenyl glycosylphosphotransferase [Brevinema sp.]
MRYIPFYPFFKFLFLLLSDMAGFYGALYCALKIRKLMPVIFPSWNFPVLQKDPYVFTELLTLFAIFFVVFVMIQLYQKRRTFWDELLVLWQALFISFLLSSLFLFNFQTILPLMSRTVFLLAFLIMLVLVPLARLIVKNLLYLVGFWQSPVVFAASKGQLSRAVSVAEAFSRDAYLGYEPIAFIGEDSQETEIAFKNKKVPLHKDIQDLPRHCSVFVVVDHLDHQDPMVVALYSIYRRVFVVPKNAVGMVGSGVAQYLFSERIFIIPLENKLNSLLAKTLKNLIDYSLGFLIVLALSPIFIITAILIKLTSKGPIFYKQDRLGKGGKLFKIWKFRSMHLNADERLKEMIASDPEIKKEWDTYLKLKNDPRITAVGHFIRKYSIDELPQLFNVVLGTMSLVGPRPFLPGEIEAVNPSLVPLYAQVKPGLTGLWQISGRNETSREERLRIDVWYLQNWSPSLDILIFLNTPLVVITARGAR